jgi:hypothetical protein
MHADVYVSINTAYVIKIHHFCPNTGTVDAPGQVGRGLAGEDVRLGRGAFRHRRGEQARERPEDGDGTRMPEHVVEADGEQRWGGEYEIAMAADPPAGAAGAPLKRLRLTPRTRTQASCWFLRGYECVIARRCRAWNAALRMK